MPVFFTDRELDIMKVLWLNGSATVAEVRDALPADRAYTTVLTLLRILEEKGHIGHREAGKAFVYYPRVAERVARRSALAKVLDTVFDGSAELLFTHLVGDRRISQTELARLRRLLNDRIGRDDA